MSYIDSMKKQGILPALGYERQRAPGGFTSGVAHPNFFGYLAQRRAIIEAIDAAAKRAPNSP